MSYVRVDGEPGLLVQLHGRAGPRASGNVVLTELFTADARQAYQIQLMSTEQDHLAYLQILWTVIGTWRWR